MGEAIRSGLVFVAVSAVAWVALRLIDRACPRREVTTYASVVLRNLGVPEIATLHADGIINLDEARAAYWRDELMPWCEVLEEFKDRGDT